MQKSVDLPKPSEVVRKDMLTLTEWERKVVERATRRCMAIDAERKRRKDLLVVLFNCKKNGA